jgi:hypothetical protein
MSIKGNLIKCNVTAQGQLYGCVFVAMSNGDRGDEPATLGNFGAFAALVLCGIIVGILAFLNGQEAVRRDKTPAAYAESAKSKAQQDCAGREGNAAFECIYEKVEASQDQARGEQNLSAQQHAANSALFSAFIALLTLILSGFGVWFVKRTLDATLKAVEDTGIATKAMQRQNELTEAAQRPWLTVIINCLGPMQRLCDGTFCCEYNVTIKNTGASPALTVGFTVGTEQATLNGQICFSSFVEEAYKLIGITSQAIAPNSEETIAGTTAVDMGEIDEDGLRPNKTIPNLWLGVAYQDGISSTAYYTTLISATGERIMPGEGSQSFILNHTKLKTIMGKIPNQS